MSLACLHFQVVTPNWNTSFAQSGMNYIKFLDDHQAIVEAKAARPNCLFVIRHRHEDTGRWFALAAQGQSYLAMGEFLAMFYDSAVRCQVDAGEGLNELYDCGNREQTRLMMLLDTALVHNLNDAYLAHKAGIVPPDKFAPELAQVIQHLINDGVPAHRIKPVVFCAAIGNPSKPVDMTQGERDALLALGRATQDAGGWFGYHCYWPVHDGKPFWGNTQVTFDLPMRWTAFDDWLVARGVKVGWAMGEAGPCLSDAGGYAIDPWAGWRHPQVYGGNLDKVFDDIATFDSLLHATPAYNEGRIAGYALFTCNNDPLDWTYFRYEPEHVLAVCHYTRDNPSPPPAPPPSPPPPPKFPVQVADISRHQGNIIWPLFAQECSERGVEGLIIRLTLGVSGLDDRAVEYYHDARAQYHWDISIYHLYRPEYGGVAQADHMLDTIDSLGIALDFYPVFDVELAGAKTPAQLSADIIAFCERVYERKGYYPIIYTAAWWWNPNTLRGTGCNPERCFTLHVAHYTTGNPIVPIDWQPDKWLLHQYTSKAVFKGVPQNTVDLSWFKGEHIDWLEWTSEFQRPPVDPCWCWPRVQYKRVVWLVHPDSKSAKAIYQSASEQNITCASSADDAGNSGCEDNTVVIWDVPVDMMPLYKDWFADHYPKVKVEFRRWIGVTPWDKLKEKLGL